MRRDACCHAAASRILLIFFQPPILISYRLQHALAPHLARRCTRIAVLQASRRRRGRPYHRHRIVRRSRWYVALLTTSSISSALLSKFRSPLVLAGLKTGLAAGNISRHEPHYVLLQIARARLLPHNDVAQDARQLTGCRHNVSTNSIANIRRRAHTHARRALHTPHAPFAHAPYRVVACPQVAPAISLRPARTPLHCCAHAANSTPCAVTNARHCGASAPATCRLLALFLGLLARRTCHQTRLWHAFLPSRMLIRLSGCPA